MMAEQLPALKHPAGIAVVAPSGAPLDDLAVEAGLERLRLQGFAVHSYYDRTQRMQRFADSDQGRVDQLHAAAVNPDVQVIMALRGSYGLSRLLPQLDWDLLAGCGKIFVGYSDFSLIHLGLLARGVQSLAGPMLCDDYSREDWNAYTLSCFIEVLQGRFRQLEFVTDSPTDLQLNGTLWGGNLAMLVHSLGTPYSAQVRDGILFLEDIGEHPYRVERMLLQLHYAGVLSQQKAIVLGDFSAYRLAEHDHGYDFAAMLAYLRSVIPVPILTGLPFGHIRQRATLAVGAEAQLTVQGTAVSLGMQHRCCLL